MNINKTPDLDIIQRLHALVEQNTSPNNIRQFLHEEFSEELSEPYIIDYIRKYLDKEWSAFLKQSKQNSDQLNQQVGLFEEGIYIDLGKKDTLTPKTDKATTTDNQDREPDNGDLKESTREEKTSDDDFKEKIVEESTTPPSRNNNMFDSLEVMDYLKALHKSVMLLDESNRNLSNHITKLENKITEMQSNNPYEKVQKFADELIEIYANEKSKKSVNINPSINDRIIEAMYKKYNISNNNALAINTALLLALYKSGIDTMPDKK